MEVLICNIFIPGSSGKPAEYELVPGAAQILVQNQRQKDTYLSPAILPLLDAGCLINQ